MTEHVASGCGPGISRPADTPQHGVRSVRVKDKGDSLARLNVAMDDVVILWDAIDNGQSDIPALARALQRAADAAMALTDSNI